MAAAIGLFIIPRMWRLVREAVNILLEGTPLHLDTPQVARELRSVPGVQEIHGLHIWSVTSGFVSLSAHVVTDESRAHSKILSELQRVLPERFDIRHSTLQLEAPPRVVEIELPDGASAQKKEENP